MNTPTELVLIISNTKYNCSHVVSNMSFIGYGSVHCPFYNKIIIIKDCPVTCLMMWLAK